MLENRLKLYIIGAYNRDFIYIWRERGTENEKIYQQINSIYVTLSVRVTIFLLHTLYSLYVVPNAIF